MRKLLLATTALLALSAFPARADILIDDHLSGTGDNVVFNALTPTRVVGAFNGQHQGLVDFDCLAGCGGFIGAQNGNDLKIANFQTLNVQVFDSAGINVLPTQTDVFSLIGTGDVTVFVTANETDGSQKLFTFDLTALFGPLGNGQNGFTLSAINGETIDHFRLIDVGGTITDFEHYRIDVAVAAVPEPATWAMMILGFLGIAGMGARKQWKGFRLA
jgi:PEP-CTERM motif